MKEKKWVYLFGIILPWCLVLLFNFFKLDASGGFLEHNAVAIRILLLTAAILSCCYILNEVFRNKLLVKKEKMVAVFIFFPILLLSIFSAFIIFVFRHGIGF